MARSRVPSSRSVASSAPIVASPLTPMFMPRMLTSIVVPREKCVPGTVALRVSSITRMNATVTITVGIRLSALV